MNKKIILILVGLFAGATGLAPESASAGDQLPITPAQVADLALVQRLTDAAAAAGLPLVPYRQLVKG